MMESKLQTLKKKWEHAPILSRLWVSGILILFFLAEVRVFIKKSGSGVRLIVAKRTLEPGIILSPHDLSVSLISEGSPEKESAFVDSDLHEVVGKKLMVSLKKGEFIRGQHLSFPEKIKFANRIPSGSRAFPLNISHEAPVEPGDHIDVFSDISKGEKTSDFVLENKKVLAVRNKNPGQEIMIAVDTNEMRKLGESDSQITWRVALRNPNDSASVGLAKRKKKTNGRNRRVEVLSEVSL